jgi:hypothetical protein
MKPPFPPLAILAVMLVFVLGLPIGLYALLTGGRRRSMREIRLRANEQGWKFRMRRWAGDPTAFQIDGSTHNGLDWVLKTIGAGTETYSPGWNAELHVLFPSLAGKEDFAILPRDANDRSGGPLLKSPLLKSPLVKSELPVTAQARVSAVSPAFGGTVEFFQDAAELPCGLPAFDAAYQILAVPQKFQQPVDAELAARILRWPEEAIAPHSVLIWRDPFGFHLKVRLPAPANWPTVSYSLSLAEQFALRLPASSVPPTPPSLVDRVVAGLQ